MAKELSAKLFSGNAGSSAPRQQSFLQEKALREFSNLVLFVQEVLHESAFIACKRNWRVMTVCEADQLAVRQQELVEKALRDAQEKQAGEEGGEEGGPRREEEELLKRGKELEEELEKLEKAYGTGFVAT